MSFGHWNPYCFLVGEEAAGPSVHSAGFGAGLGVSLDLIPNLQLPTFAPWVSTLSLWSPVASPGRKVRVPQGTDVRSAYVVSWVQSLEKCSLHQCSLSSLPAPVSGLEVRTPAFQSWQTHHQPGLTSRSFYFSELLFLPWENGGEGWAVRKATPAFRDPEPQATLHFLSAFLHLWSMTLSFAPGTTTC